MMSGMRKLLKNTEGLLEKVKRPSLRSIKGGGIAKSTVGRKASVGIREDMVIEWGDDGLLFADGYDDAIIGVCLGHDAGRVVYDVSKMIEVCMRDTGMEYEQTWEWLEYNTFGAYVGEGTPLYVSRSPSEP